MALRLAQLPLAGHRFVRMKGGKNILLAAIYSISGQIVQFRPAQNAAAHRWQVPYRLLSCYGCAGRHRRLGGERCTLQ
jgi:hypothetical protein